jgi:hypothetical protein
MLKMNNQDRVLLKDIAQLTQTIQSQYPSLYLNLSEEKPAFDPENDDNGLTVNELQTYLDFLKSRLNHFLEVKKGI